MVISRLNKKLTLVIIAYYILMPLGIVNKKATGTKQLLGWLNMARKDTQI